MTIIPNAAKISATSSEFNAASFLSDRILGKTATAMLVIVKATSNAGAVAGVGTVDVQPMVNQIDGAGKAVAHGVIYSVPVFRFEAAGNAIILDPQIGDIGLAVFASHDISAVKANKKVSNPGSRRRFDMADALYFGGFLGGVPTQYVRFSASGIAIVSPSAVDITAPTTTIHGSLVVTGNATIGGKDFLAHGHTGVTTGSGTTGPVA